MAAGTEILSLQWHLCFLCSEFEVLVEAASDLGRCEFKVPRCLKALDHHHRVQTGKLRDSAGLDFLGSGRGELRSDGPLHLRRLVEQALFAVRHEHPDTGADDALLHALLVDHAAPV